ncbi:MAG: hypothetical protein LIP10_03990 [Clostridiales bacterium]|nr:hypothetical protein [Clostridiales bacterium]
MKDFNIIIEEHITQGFLLSAKSWEEAEMLAKKKYDNGELVVTPGIVTARLMSVAEEGMDHQDFREF